MEDKKVTRKDDRAKERQNPVTQTPSPKTFCLESGAVLGIIVLERTSAPPALLPTAHMSFALGRLHLTLIA